MLNRRVLMAASLAAPALPASRVLAQDQAIAGIATTTTYVADGRLTSVDPAAHTVTLTFDNGVVVTRQVSPAVANYGGSRIGDRVSVGFEERRTFVLSGPNVKVPVDSTTSAVGVGTMGNTTGGFAASRSIGTWLVTAVDPAANTLSLVDPAGGGRHTYNVTSDAGRAQLPRVKRGDRLTAINSSITAVSITPKA